MLERGLPGLIVLALVGCASAKPAAPPKAEAVTLSEQAPPGGYVAVRELSVQSGKGCGLLADRGSREDADRKLRSAALQLGATYVQVTTRREPAVNHQCMEHEFQVSGVAYRAPVPRLASPAAPAPSASAPPPVPPVPPGSSAPPAP